jgi:ribosomal protein L37AE/L43A
MSTRIGVAAHISAAAPLGPRYDPSMTPAERSSPANGIWLCANCARRIDADVDNFSCELLNTWKAHAEYEANQQLGKPRTLLFEERDNAPFTCPHCHSGFFRGQTVCRGCHGQIVEGATVEERKAALMIGAVCVGGPLLYTYSKMGLRLVLFAHGAVELIPLLVLGVCSLGAGAYAVSLAEKHRRKKNPRVFVRTLV